ncbi:TetR/AcrR family transcriptional regulator [Marispirochaeta aestuarii]|uniref:TetR/AcrR family transcriptional regulator n=1 Tax=Marispirochaeta aestuarii TaxID=1963862 RepID=UPI0029C6736C|nr:TetR/AcrR family transcriptional regulator [Marispirochaeta aestuarii]
MPPETFFTAEMILDEAFRILRTEGLNSVTARKISANLGCSTQPIYSVFRSMRELKEEVIRKARQYALHYLLAEPMEGKESYSMGLQYFKFAREESLLFRQLFLSGKSAMTLDKMTDYSGPLIERMKKDPELQGLNESQIGRIGRDMWIYTHGIILFSFESEAEGIEEKVKSSIYHMGKTIIEWEHNKKEE